jgi:succinoglycan biosynthesis transport protein ExoP
MENATTFHPLDYVAVVRRRLWWLVIPIALAIVVGLALVKWLPRQYQGVATIGISLPALTPELLTTAARPTPEERVRNVNQVINSPAVLERVVREEGFEQHMPLKDAASFVRGRIKVTLVKSEVPSPNPTVDQFQIAYHDSTPQMAQRVTNRLVNVFVDENSRKREVRAEETSAFIVKQVEASQERLALLEARLRTAKEAFMGALPEQTNANVSMVTGLQQQLETTANGIRGEQDRLSMIERQIEAMKAGAANEIAVPGAPMTASPAAVRVVTLERELAVARGNYTDKHPEIVRLREEIKAARAEAAAEMNRPEADRVASLRVDPSYRALLADREQSRLRIRELQRHDTQLRKQIAMYRARVESAPRVEQQLATVQREYDLEKEQYGQLTTKKRNAEIAEGVERNRGGEQFTVLSYSGLPSEPYSPNTQRLLVVTILLGLCLGGGLAMGREYLDRSVHDRRALSDLDLPVLGEIPRIAHAR